MNKKMPDIILRKFGNTRAFKASKRRAFDTVLKAFDDFTLGCAYVPGFDEHCEDIRKNMRAWREKMTTQNWGR